MLNHVKAYVVFAFLCIGLIPSVAASDHDDQGKTLLVVGDSLSAAYGLMQSEGWVSLLENLWINEQRGIDVVNAAISGDTTDGGLARLPRLLDQHNPTHILIELGGNDGLRGQNIVKMRNNLEKMIQLSRESGAQVFLQDMEIPTNYGARYTRMFSDTFEQLAEKHDVVLVPFLLADVALDENLMQRDGIHPNKQAQPIIARFMHNQLTPFILAE